MAFEVRPADVEELTEGEPSEVALENARRKAAAIDADCVLGVDTIVALDGVIYGKPASEQEARATLSALAGRTHQVISGLAVTKRGRTPFCHAETTDVTFRQLDDGWIEWYVGTGEWCDRAGGYAIQGRGAALVRRIEGDYLNVVGLPVVALLDMVPELVRA